MKNRYADPGLLIPLALLSGCTLGPDFTPPSAPAAESYLADQQLSATVEADGTAQHFQMGGKIAEQWWQLFKSPQLNDIVKEALAKNLSLKASEANLRQSQASLQAGYGVFFPQLDFTFTPSRQRFSAAKFGSSTPGTVFNLFTASTTVSYVLDVFGAERRTVESLEAQKDLQRYTALATYITLTGNIINTVIARAAYQAEATATEQLIGSIRQQISLTTAQVTAGTITYQTLLTLRSQLAAAEASLPPLQQQISQAEHLQASLVGRTPIEWQAPNIKIADMVLPGDIPLSLPSTLVHERPDILTAEAQLHSDSAKIGISTAALFPTISLSASYGYNNQSLTNLLLNNGNLWAMAGNFAQPLFHGGSLWFNRKAALQSYQRSLDSYQQTVISAFQQVADTLKALEHDAETLAAQQQARAATESSLKLVKANYAAGLINYQQVLGVEIQLQQANIAFMQAKAQRFQDTVALFVALGGGWRDNEVKDTP